MVDYLRALESLIPEPHFAGTMKDNTLEQFNAIEWKDARKKPTEAELVAEDTVLNAADVVEAAEKTKDEKVEVYKLKAARDLADKAGDSATVAEIDVELAKLPSV